MSKSKLTLVIDGNWLLMSRLAVTSKGSSYKSDEELMQDLKFKMIRSINVVLRTFKEIDNIIFVADGGSWRNNVEVPECLKSDSIEYKGTRVRTDDFDWDLLFSSYEDFISVLASTGITCSKEHGLEGDDWCYHWSRLLNSEGTNVMIWSADKDLTQLVTIDKDKCFTVGYNAKHHIVTAEHPENEFDFFFNQSFNTNEKLYNSICEKCTQIDEIQPKDIVIDKILRGDLGDNIQPIILRNSKSGSTKKFKISSKDIDYDLDIFDDKAVIEYLTNLYNSKNYIGRIDKSLDDVIKHFFYNRTLVTLDAKVMPTEVLETFTKHDEYNMTKDISIAESQITASTNKLSGILEII